MRNKRVCGLIAAVVLGLALSIPVSAEGGFLFYGKGDMPADYAPNMAVWNGHAGAFSAKVADGVRIGTAKTAGAYFAFPTYLVKEKSDFSQMRMIEIALKNEKAFSMDIGVVISDNETYNMTGHEHFSLKTNVAACIRTADGKLLRRTTYGDSINIPGGFNGKVYVPLGKDDWAPLSWATVDGELNLKKITNVSFTVNSMDASVIIGDVRVIDEDLVPQAEEIPFPTTTTSTTVPGSKTASSTQAGGLPGQAATQKDGTPVTPGRTQAAGQGGGQGGAATAAGSGQVTRPASGAPGAAGETGKSGDTPAGPAATAAPGTQQEGGGTAGWLPFLIGGAVVLVLAAAAVTGILLYRRKKTPPPAPPQA